MWRGCGRVPSQMLIATVAHELAQGRAGDGVAQGLEHRRALVRSCGRVERLDDGRAGVRQLDREAVAAVGELDPHRTGAISSGGA
jgi:hypothetical protein